MRVFLKKDIKVSDTQLLKNEEGYIWCCLIHNDSFLVVFKKGMFEIPRTNMDFLGAK